MTHRPHREAGPRSRRELKAIETRHRILSASAQMILATGTDFTLAPILAHSEVSKSLVLSHFPSRDELIRGVLAEGIHRSNTLTSIEPGGRVHGSGIGAVTHWMLDVLHKTIGDPVMLASHRLLQTPLARQLTLPSMYPVWTEHLTDRLRLSAPTDQLAADAAGLLTGLLAGLFAQHTSTSDSVEHAHRSVHSTLMMLLPEVVESDADAAFARQYLDRVFELTTTK